MPPRKPSRIPRLVQGKRPATPYPSATNSPDVTIVTSGVELPASMSASDTGTPHPESETLARPEREATFIVSERSGLFPVPSTSASGRGSALTQGTNSGTNRNAFAPPIRSSTFVVIVPPIILTELELSPSPASQDTPTTEPLPSTSRGVESRTNTDTEPTPGPSRPMSPAVRAFHRRTDFEYERRHPDYHYTTAVLASHGYRYHHGRLMHLTDSEILTRLAFSREVTNRVSEMFHEIDRNAEMNPRPPPPPILDMSRPLATIPPEERPPTTRREYEILRAMIRRLQLIKDMTYAITFWLPPYN